MDLEVNVEADLHDRVRIRRQGRLVGIIKDHGHKACIFGKQLLVAAANQQVMHPGPFIHDRGGKIRYAEPVPLRLRKKVFGDHVAAKEIAAVYGGGVFIAAVVFAVVVVGAAGAERQLFGGADGYKRRHIDVGRASDPGTGTCPEIDPVLKLRKIVGSRMVIERLLWRVRIGIRHLLRCRQKWRRKATEHEKAFQWVHYLISS